MGVHVDSRSFCWSGGVDEGIRLLDIGQNVVGVEWEMDACRTAKAAGHARIRGDVSKLDPRMFAGAVGCHASPPCQAWSAAGKRKGELDRANCHRLADRMAAGDDSTGWTAWEDERSPLVCQPIRWVRVLRPEWVTLEEVPAVAALWEHFARIFRGWGYSVWTGDLNSADFGVPQTRTRRILIASRARKVQPPEPTHAEVESGCDLFGGSGRERWVSMAEALGWSPGVTVNTRGERKTSGGNEFSADRPSWALTEKTRSWMASSGSAPSWSMGDVRSSNGTVRTIAEPSATITAAMDNGNFRWVYRGSNQANCARRPLDEPAPTVNFGARSNKVEWMPEQLATDPRADGVRVTVEEAAVLQGFPIGYPWRGSKSKRFLCVGNAVPPLLAAHFVSAASGAPFRAEAVTVAGAVA